MSWISDIIMKHIHEYDKAKTGEWSKMEPPPANVFTKSELYLIGRSIVSEIEGKLSDKYLEINP